MSNEVKTLDEEVAELSQEDALAELLRTLAGGIFYREETQRDRAFALIAHVTGGRYDEDPAPVAAGSAPDRDGDGDVDDADELRGEALDERVRELGIEGASRMSADEKRAAVRKAEAGE